MTLYSQRLASCGRAESILHLVDLGLDEEKLNERGRAVDGRVDVLQSDARLVYEVKVLRQEILHPQQGGWGLLLPVICTHFTEVTQSVWSQTSAFMPDSDFRNEATLTIFTKHSTAF